MVPYSDHRLNNKLKVGYSGHGLNSELKVWYSNGRNLFFNLSCNLLLSLDCFISRNKIHFKVKWSRLNNRLRDYHDLNSKLLVCYSNGDLNNEQKVHYSNGRNLFFNQSHNLDYSTFHLVFPILYINIIFIYI